MLVFFPPFSLMPESCFQYFFAPMLLYTSIGPCNSFLDIWHWNSSHILPSPQPCSFPAPSFLTCLHLNLSLLTFSYFLSLHAVLTSSCPPPRSLLSTNLWPVFVLFSFLSFSFLCWVCLWLFAPVQLKSLSLVSIVSRLQCFNSLCCSSLTT